MESPAAPKTNYVRDNAKNLLRAAAEKLHPTFDVWRPSYQAKATKLDSCASSDNTGNGIN